MKEHKTVLEKAEEAFEDGNFDLLKKILPSLLEQNVAAAIRLNSSFFDSDMTEDECDQIYVDGMFKAAELGDLKAKYHVGIIYDLGEYGIPQNRQKASEIFKELSELGDSHCRWIYSCELISGDGSFPRSIKQGIKLLHQAADSGSAEACITIAGFYDEGKFEHEPDSDRRDYYRKLANKYDETTFDPYA